ncbi:MAG: acetylglutamate kinase [Zavarzinella sp.]
MLAATLPNTIADLRMIAGSLQHERGAIFVIKLGGSAMEDPQQVSATLESIWLLQQLEVHPVLIHGGGKAIDQAMAAAGLTPRKVQGRRYTDIETLAIVVDTLTNTINRQLCEQLSDIGVPAQSMHLGDYQVLFGEQFFLQNADGTTTDLGHVGSVTRVNRAAIQQVLDAGAVPVIPCIAQGPDGGWLNINGDTAAGAVAASLKSSRLYMMTDTPGLLQQPKDPSSLIHRLAPTLRRELETAGVIDGGMLPKVEACFEALQAGVQRAKIIDGRRAYSLLLDCDPSTAIGTECVL